MINLFPSILQFIASFLIPTPPVFPGLHCGHHSSKPLLRLNSQNEFNIAIFADLHYGEEETGWGIHQDIKSTALMSKMLDYEQPDFVIINGDLITGENTFLENSTSYVDVIVQPMVQKGVKWASTYGNHDSQFNLSRKALFLAESQYDLSYTQHLPLEVGGVTNYYLLVYPHAHTAQAKPVAILWFFDSQGGFPFQKSPEFEELPNWVERDVVDWFVRERDAMVNKWGVLSSLAFVHIPPTGFLQIQNSLLPHAGDKNVHFPGLNDDVPVDSQGTGIGKDDSLFMAALQETEGLIAVFSGHDHGDSWCGNWPGGGRPRLCFCKHTGYGGYGNWNRGSRVVRLRFEEGEVDVESWVRMESGRVIQRVGLNETYGVDVYPSDNGEERSSELVEKHNS